MPEHAELQADASVSKPIDPKVAEHAVTLVGYGRSQEEAARAVGVTPRSRQARWSLFSLPCFPQFATRRAATPSAVLEGGLRATRAPGTLRGA